MTLSRRARDFCHDGGVLIILICLFLVIPMSCIWVVTEGWAYDDCHAPLHDEIVCIVDDVETHISTAGKDLRNEVFAFISENRGQFVSICFTDGSHGHDRTILVCWVKEIKNQIEGVSE